MVKFSKANAKLENLKNNDDLWFNWLWEGERKVYSFDLLSGHSCPFAEKCLSKAVVVDGKRKIKDGPKTEFRCFSASQEVQYTNVYNLRSSNFNSLRKLSEDEIYEAITNAQPDDLGICRIHVAGDFFNQEYFNAWVRVTIDNPDRLYYAYTKSLPYWRDADIRSNMILTASRGGRRDELIDLHSLREAVVVYSEEMADNMGLEIDHDDTHAADPLVADNSFALLIHGTQPKGSEASDALKLLRKNKVKHSYSRKK